MRTGRLLVASMVLALGLTSSAFALNASATIDIGDRIYGRIETAGDFDRITFDAPREATLSFTVRALDPELGLSMVLYPPDAPGTPEPIDAYLRGTPAKLKLKNFPARTGGDWVLEIRAAAGTLGRYKLKTAIVYRTSWKSEEDIGVHAEVPIPFAATFGSRLKLKVKVRSGDIAPIVTLLRTPTGVVLLPEDLKQSEIPLNVTGEYALVVENPTAAEGRIKAALKVKTTVGPRSKMYLSPRGFGPAPVVDAVSPKSALQGSLVTGVTVDGFGFEEGVGICLRRSGKPDVPGQDVVRVSDSEISCSFDLADLKTGVWELVVENPSGGDDEGTFSVKSPTGITLPPGVLTDTEVWFIEFDEGFVADLALFGLSGTSTTVSAKAAEYVKSYVIYDLREIFGNRGGDGKVRSGAVAVSFVRDKPTSLVGSPGTTYNRLRIGGAAQPGDPASDNAFVPWGFTPVDAGNTRFDDLSRDGGAGRGLFLRALVPGGSGVAPTFNAAFAPMLASPVALLDEKYFSATYDPATVADANRYRDIDYAIRTLSYEVAAVAAHHIARAMGLANGTVGVSSTPPQVGTFAAMDPPAFEAIEIATLDASVLKSRLPGVAPSLVPSYLPLRGLAPFLLPEVPTATNTRIALPHAGGRPNLRATDLVYTGTYGLLPIDFAIGPAEISGNSPYLLSNVTWNYGVFKFGISIRDPVTGDDDPADHRINLVINMALVPPGQQTQALGINVQIRAAP